MFEGRTYGDSADSNVLAEYSDDSLSDPGFSLLEPDDLCHRIYDLQRQTSGQRLVNPGSNSHKGNPLHYFSSNFHTHIITLYSALPAFSNQFSFYFAVCSFDLQGS